MLKINYTDKMKPVSVLKKYINSKWYNNKIIIVIII